MRRQLLRCALAGTVVLSLRPVVLPAQYTQPSNEIEAPEIRKVVIRGVKNVSESQLAGTLATQPSHCKSLFLQPFCWISHSPTIVDRQYLDRTEYKRDVLRIRVFYWQRGFREATVDTSIARFKNGVAVTFTVQEGPPTRITRLRVEYDSTLISEKQRQRLTLLHAGEPLDLLQLDTMRVLFQNEMWNHGYGDAQVDTTVQVNAEAREANVELRVIPNWKTIVGPISIQGNKQVSSKTILNTITLRPGDAFKRSELLISQQSLYQSQLFRRATIVPGSPADSVKQLRIEVDEAPEHYARAGVGLNNVDYFQTQARFEHYNFLGGARQLDIQTTLSNLLAPQLNGWGPFRNVVGNALIDTSLFLQPTWDASIDFRQPAFVYRSAITFGLGVFSHRRQAPAVYVDRGYGAGITATHNLALRAPLSLSYRYEISRVEASDVYYCVNFGVCDIPTIETMRTHSSLSPVTLSGYVDRTDATFTPSRGYLARWAFDYASPATQSDYDFTRGFFDVAAYTHFHRNTRQVLAEHLQLGILRPLASNSAIHPRIRFYAGGSNSVRGFNENQLGPRVLTIDSATLVKACPGVVDIRRCNPNSPALPNSDFVPQPIGGTSLAVASVEYRFPLMLKVDGAVFVDAGIVGENALSVLGDISSLTKGQGAVTPGFGFRYRSPVGPVRVDVGFNPMRSEDLPVVTSIHENGLQRIVGLEAPRTYSRDTGFFNRLTLHLAVGQAF